MFKIMLSSILLVGSVMADVIKPEDARQHRDILTVSGNRSSYYILKNESLVYKVKGPQRIKIYSRAVLTRKTSKSNSFEFEIQLNGNQPLQVRHQQKCTSRVKSPQHPNHYFTRAAKDFISIPAGINEVVIRPRKRSEPVLIRILRDKSISAGKKKRIDPLSEEAPVKLRSGSKLLSYYGLRKDHPLFVTLEGPVILNVTSRLGFAPQMGREEDYRLQILDNGKVVGTYYFSTTRSDVSTVIGQDDVLPGKWRSCNVKLGKGLHEIKLRLLDTQRQVFIKLKKTVDK
ncbi:MAG: hypothetical protein U9Q77_09930 [Candidatus Marinimicrobia bacterium]|nr:hypothetical protein [Candidatus Neomarinimicrobiota bacterium]